MVMDGGSSISVGGDTFVKIKGRIDSNEPKNTLLVWELALGKSYTNPFVFVIPAQTQGPRFEVASSEKK